MPFPGLEWYWIVLGPGAVPASVEAVRVRVLKTWMSLLVGDL